MLSERSSALQQMWLDVLEGRVMYSLRHGYFCTRQPDDQDRENNITHAEAREKEAKYFRSTAPWSTSSNSQAFGTPRLVENLSKQLIEIIHHT